jgi:hypothetical protein
MTPQRHNANLIVSGMESAQNRRSASCTPRSRGEWSIGGIMWTIFLFLAVVAVVGNVVLYYQNRRMDADLARIERWTP